MRFRAVALSLGLLGVLPSCDMIVQPNTTCSDTRWGPVHSYYSGNKVVRGEGCATWDYSYGHNKITVTDMLADGNSTHGYTRFYEKMDTLSGPDFVHKTMKVTASTKGAGTSVADTHSRHPTEYSYGQMRIATAVCAQMGWPVPDSCTAESYFLINW